MRNFNLSTRFVFLFNIVTVLVLVTYLVDLQNKIVSAKSDGNSNYDRSNKLVSAQMEGMFKFVPIISMFYKALYIVKQELCNPTSSQLQI